MGMRWNENQPEDHVRYARNDLMGLVKTLVTIWPSRDSTVHMFDEWGLPMMKDKKLEVQKREVANHDTWWLQT